MSQHKVRLHKWINGTLHWAEHAFESRKAAIEFAENSDSHVAKVLDGNGSLTYQITQNQTAADAINQTLSTYA